MTLEMKTRVAAIGNKTTDTIAVISLFFILEDFYIFISSYEVEVIFTRTLTQIVSHLYLGPKTFLA